MISLLLPPAGLLLMAAIGLLALPMRPRLGYPVALIAVLGLWILGMPVTGRALLVSLERFPARPASASPPGAIVILGGDLKLIRAAGLRADIGPLTLERLRAGAALYRRVGLPILVTGGTWISGNQTLAGLMDTSLADDFGVPVRWREGRALDTMQNAEYSTSILSASGIRSVYLVTHAWHMRRAMMAFARTGVAVYPAPTELDRQSLISVPSFIPSVSGWGMSYFALHEWLGCAYYALR